MVGGGGGQSPFNHIDGKKINLSQDVYRQDNLPFN